MIKANVFKAGNNRRIKNLTGEINDIGKLSRLKQKKKNNKDKIKKSKAQIKELERTNDQIRKLIKNRDDREIKKIIYTKENSQYRYRQNINEILNERFDNKNIFKLNGTLVIEDTDNKIRTNRFFEDGEELGFFIDAILDKYDDIPNILFTGDIYVHHRIFNEVRRSDYSKGADEFFDIVEYKGKQCYIPTGNACFLKCINYVYNIDYTAEYYTFLKTFKRQTNVMLKTRIPIFCKRVGINIGFCSEEKKRILPRSCPERNKCIYLHKHHYCVLWKNSIRESLLTSSKEVENNFQYIRKEIDNRKLKNVIKYSFPFKQNHHELDNIFIFDIETANVEDKAILTLLFYVILVV